MASCSVSERDFAAVSRAALDYWHQDSRDVAVVLDELARKMNAALSHASTRRKLGPTFLRTDLHSDIESPLESAGLRTKRKRRK